jgi:hypothetical protein
MKKTIINCRCLSNNCKLSIFGIIYIAAYLFLFMCFGLRTYSNNIFIDKNFDLMKNLSIEMPGPFIPDECDNDYMKNCARVSFDGCTEKK